MNKIHIAKSIKALSGKEKRVSLCNNQSNNLELRRPIDFLKERQINQNTVCEKCYKILKGGL